MVALIDVDDTLASLQRQILKYANKNKPNTYCWSDFTRDFREGKDAAYQKLVDDFLADPTNTLRAPVYPTVLPALRLLKDAGYQLHIASARKEHLHQATERWLDMHDLRSLVDAIHPRYTPTSGVDFKLRTAKRIKATVAFDDTYDVALILAEAGIKTFLLTKPWNKAEPRHRNIRRAPSIYRAVLKHLAA